MVKTLAPIREKAAEWKAHPERIRQVLGDGAQTARVLAHDTHGQGARGARPLRMKRAAIVRRRGLTLALAVCGRGGCGTRSPEGAVRALAEAAEAGDRDAV